MNHLACAKAERVLTAWTVPIEKGADPSGWRQGSAELAALGERLCENGLAA